MNTYGDLGNKRYFLYCTNANEAIAIALLTSRAIQYDSHAAIQNGVKEISFSCNSEQRDDLTSEIFGSGKPVVIRDTRLDISSSIGTVTATITASDIKVGSTDQTATNSKYIKTETTGEVHVEQINNALPAGANKIGNVNIEQPTAIIDFSHTTSGATAEQLAANAVINKVTIQNEPTSGVYVLVGNATSQNLKLGPGQSIDLRVSNTNAIYVKRVTTDVQVNIFGS